MSSVNRKFFIEALKGDQYAVEFCETFFNACQLWDDLIDRDKERSDQDINNVFLDLLVKIPSNPFYRSNQSYLTPIINHVVLDWLDANKLESGSELQKQVSYTLRDSFNQLLAHCAFLIAGREWMQTVSEQIRKHVFTETMQEYIEGLDNG